MTARYTYLADATKLEVVDNDGWGYDYLGSLVYRKNDDDSYTLESTAFSGGRIVRNSSGSYRINGFVTDHLGSIRTVYDMETGDIIERNDYYPFGKRLNNSLAMSPTNRYRFSGKVARGSQRTFLCSRPEQQGFSPPVQQVVANINLLDFGARMYDDEICRWTTVDPLAEKYYSMTPYNYCANNPVMFVDPEGRAVNFIVGAIAGAALDYGTQVVTNIICGHSLGESLTNINGKSILISAGAGAAGVGIVSKVKQLSNLGKTLKTITIISSESGIGAITSVASQLSSDGTVSFDKVAFDTALSAVSVGIGARVKIAKQSSTEYRQAAKELNHAKRVARGNHPRQSRSAKVQAAQEKLDNVGNAESGLAKSSATITGTATKTIIATNKDEK